MKKTIEKPNFKHVPRILRAQKRSTFHALPPKRPYQRGTANLDLQGESAQSDVRQSAAHPRQYWPGRLLCPVCRTKQSWGIMGICDSQSFGCPNRDWEMIIDDIGFINTTCPCNATLLSSEINPIISNKAITFLKLARSLKPSMLPARGCCLCYQPLATARKGFALQFCRLEPVEKQTCLQTLGKQGFDNEG